MIRVRFAPSPTGTLHVGNALSAIANRRFGDWMLLRLDDTDAARNVPGGETAILDDLRWLGVEWDDGPARQSERSARHLEAARAAGLAQRFEGGVMLWRDDDTPRSIDTRYTSVWFFASFQSGVVTVYNNHLPSGLGAGLPTCFICLMSMNVMGRLASRWARQRRWPTRSSSWASTV